MDLLIYSLVKGDQEQQLHLNPLFYVTVGSKKPQRGYKKFSFRPSGCNRTRLFRSTSVLRLNLRELYARKLIVCVPLTPAFKGAYFKWCISCVQWSQEVWARIFFIYKSKYSVNMESGHILI